MSATSPLYPFRHWLAILTVVSSLSSILSAPRYHAWQWLASLPLGLVSIYFFYQPRHIHRAVCGKIISDMVLTTITLWVGTMPSVQVFVLIYLTGVIYFAFNVFLLHSATIQVSLLFYLLLPMFFGVYATLNHRLHGDLLPVMLLSLLSAVLFSAVYAMRRREDHRSQQKFRDLEMRYQVADSTLRLSELRERLMLHDCRNVLGELSQVELATHQGKIDPQVARNIMAVQKKLVEKLDALWNLAAVEICAARNITGMVALTPPGAKGYGVTLPEDLTIHMDPHLFESIVYNLCRNAWEAWGAHPASYAGFRLNISWEKDHILFADNCGGFDPNKIAAGVTTKKKGQGLFLHTLRAHQKHLGLGFAIERGPQGMLARFYPNPTQE